MTRRIVEDEFVKQLKARGTDAIASYTLIAEQGPVDKSRLEAALRESRSDAAITTRVVKVERKSQVVPSSPQVGSPQAVPGSPLIPYYDIYGFYGSGFPGAGPATRRRRRCSSTTTSGSRRSSSMRARRRSSGPPIATSSRRPSRRGTAPTSRRR